MNVKKSNVNMPSMHTKSNKTEKHNKILPMEKSYCNQPVLYRPDNCAPLTVQNQYSLYNKKTQMDS